MRRKLQNLINNLKTLPVHNVPTPSDSTAPRASVAIVIRIRPAEGTVPYVPDGMNDPLEYLRLPWVQSGEVEVLFVRRAVNPRDRWSGHMAFPGGKANPGESDQAAAERETMEEIGVDLCTENYMILGALDQREIKSPKTGQLWVILCPYVYLQVTPVTPPITLSEKEIASVHWVPLSFFLTAAKDPRRWRQIRYPIGSAVVEPTFLPGHTIWRRYFRSFIQVTIGFCLGSVIYRGVLLPNERPEWTLRDPSPPPPNDPKIASQSTSDRLLLWGLTLGMTSEMVDLCYEPQSVPRVSLQTMGESQFSHGDIGVIYRAVKNIKKGWHNLKSGSKSSRGSEERGRRHTSSDQDANRIDQHVAIRYAVVGSLAWRTFALVWTARNVRRFGIWLGTML